MPAWNQSNIINYIFVGLVNVSRFNANRARVCFVDEVHKKFAAERFFVGLRESRDRKVAGSCMIL